MVRADRVVVLLDMLARGAGDWKGGAVMLFGADAVVLLERLVEAQERQAHQQYVRNHLVAASLRLSGLPPDEAARLSALIEE